MHRTPVALTALLVLCSACKDGSGVEEADGGVAVTEGGTTGASEPGTTGATADATTTTATTDTPTTGDGEALRPNWHQDIAPLTAMHCGGCHYAGGIAPFGMESYEETVSWAPVMAVDVEMATMPPWHALETDECQPPFAFKHDARLSDEEKALFIDWAAIGAPEGDPALAVPIPDAPSLDLAGVSATALMASAITVEGSNTTRDFFNCLSIDPGNTETVYVDGIQVLAGNPAIVHHVLIYVDAEGESKKWGASGVKQDCGGGAGIAGSPQLIAAWVPGSMPIEPPADVATEIPPGTRLILNVHYHAAATAQTDSATGLALRWKTTPPKWSSLFALVGAPGLGDSLTGPLEIEAGAEDHVEEYVWPIAFNGKKLPDLLDVRVWAVLNHMHKVGVDLRVWVESGETGDETCLLQTPRWDYNWQRSYAYDTPVTEGFRVRAGDKVHVRCTYDNTLQNPGVQEMLNELDLDEPFKVTLGEGTNNEMCLSGLGVAVKGAL